MHESSPAAKPDRLPLFALFAANAISMVGNMLTMVAIPWFVLQTTGSPTQTGITGFFNILPVVLAGLLGGALVDRIGYKGTSIIADLASGVTVALVPLLFTTIGLPFWALMVLVFLGALLDAPGSTARAALVPELAARAGMPIERAAASIHVIERSSRLIGAPLAGLLIAFLGTANVLWLDAASFAVSALLIGMFVHVPRLREKGAVQTNYWADIAQGWKFLLGESVLLAIMISVMVTNLLDAAFGGVVQPVYVRQIYGDALPLGLLIAANGGGAVLGGLVFGWIGHRLPRHATFTAMFFLTGLRFFAYALYPPLWVLILATFVFSIGAGPLNPIIHAVEYERIPPDMRGRVFGVLTAGAWAVMPVSTLVSGVLTESLGVRPMLIGIGCLYLITTLCMGWVPSMRAMDRMAVRAAKEPS
jgi:MFS family permease